MDWTLTLVMFGSFFLLVFAGVPISFSIGLATLAAGAMMLPFETILTVISQKMATGLDSFSLLAIPFFFLAGTLMNSGGIAQRLINLSQVLVGRVPGSLGHVNVMANMMFGSISGSAVAAAVAVGGTMAPMQKKAGYDPAYSAAINVTSCISGLLIPPSNVLIIYALTAGGISVATLFMAGYVPGILMGLSVMLVAGFIAKRRGYPVTERPTLGLVLRVFWEALPSLMLVVVVMGGILGGIFTATEASAIAVVYTFILSVVIYRQVKLKDLPAILLDSVITTAIVLLLIGISVGMSWAMTNADIPYTISEGLMAVSDNPIVILLIINVILLIVGIFMDMTPAVLIFTPIFLPIVNELGMDPVHFGIMMVFNLCIGLCTPPVGSALFVGCSVSGVKIQSLIKPMLPFFAVLLVALMAVTFIPSLSLALPGMFGLR
ncbi:MULTISPECIES: TRAP transporter large permease [Enterobacteriaceae]|uniref:TRAP transporter large permease protein n=1 Tax=Atlantibacter subterraneus TaxID=255519 RepID=A0A3R9FT12_9ENTR|nr:MULTISPECIES: TRAP transporter large permease [Enterobacteriaceae]MDZ5668344.1 TRAP transporter large permease [Atlantibacter hermannii]QFH70004.1 TRAP transporter large permease [Enterobacter sp. E76]MDA3131805.1 TRAP transporter large permease [Atlantibacter subterranea]MDV7025152.1 TRAP transporter large permease [Atlantibacter subterranea]MDW2744336.1 TRAP transporter large permease [Atlantibacter subterranea]